LPPTPVLPHASVTGGYGHSGWLATRLVSFFQGTLATNGLNVPRRHRRRAAAATAAAKTPLKTERRAAAPCRIAVAATETIYTRSLHIVSVQPPLCFRNERKISDGTKSLHADLPSSQQDRRTGQELDPDRALVRTYGTCVPRIEPWFRFLAPQAGRTEISRARAVGRQFLARNEARRRRWAAPTARVLGVVMIEIG
jgi:hypothetical protein